MVYDIMDLFEGLKQEKPEIKSSKKRKADAATESAADPKAAKQTRAITQQAQSVMIAELRTFHYAESSDFAKLTWEAFKKENPEKVTAIVNARQQVFKSHKKTEDRNIAVGHLKEHWRNRRRAAACAQRILASAGRCTSPESSSKASSEDNEEEAPSLDTAHGKEPSAPIGGDNATIAPGGGDKSTIAPCGGKKSTRPKRGNVNSRAGET